MELKIRVPKSIISTLNQLYEMEQKLRKNGDSGNLLRNLEKIKEAFEHYDHNDLALCIVYEDPLGCSFTETRTDMEATISGHLTDDLVVVEVIKPIIRALLQDGPVKIAKVIQKGIVIVKSRKEKQ